MEADDFLHEDIKSSVERYEKMVKNNDHLFFETEDLEDIIDYYIGSDKLDKALKVISFAESQHPYGVTFMVKKANILLVNGKFEEALEVVERAEIFEPSNFEVWMLKGEILMNNKELEQAQVCFDKALYHADEPNDLCMSVAYIYENHDRFEQAIHYLKQVLETNPNSYEAMYEIAYCYDMLNRLEDSIALYEKLIDEDPYSAAAWFNLGSVYNKLEDYNRALMAFDYAAIINPDHSTAHFNKANTLVELERFHEAVEEYKTTLELEGPDPITFCNIGGCYERLQMPAEARSYYKQAAKVNKNFAEAWFGLGITYDMEGRYHDSLSYMKRALQLAPENTDYLLANADALYKIGELKEAKKTYEKLLEIDPTVQEAWMEWSYVCFEEGDVEGAIELLMNAIKIYPDEADFYYRIVAYLYQIGRSKEAYFYLEQALSLNPEGYHELLDFAPRLREVKYIIELIDFHQK